MTIDVPLGDMSQGLLGSNQLTTIDHSELSAQLGLGLGGGNILQRPQSPENPLSATASPTSSLQDDDMDDFRRVRLYMLSLIYNKPLQECVLNHSSYNFKAPTVYPFPDLLFFIIYSNGATSHN